MTAYNKIAAFVDEFKFKRGRYVGEAPVEQRGKTHFRAIVRSEQRAAVRFHATDILIAFSDGRVELDTNGWYTSPTTRAAMWGASNKFFYPVALSTTNLNGYKNTSVRVKGRTYVYYDGMEFDADGQLLTPERPFLTYRADEEARAAWDAAMAPFKEVFPVMYTAATKTTNFRMSSWAFNYSVARLPAEDYGRAAAFIRNATDADSTWQRAWSLFRATAVKNLNKIVELEHATV